jgi:hypothetical protein
LNLNEIKKVLFSALVASIFLASCSSSGKLAEGDSFKYKVGEIVYYKVDHMPMLIEKQLVSKGTKQYKVVFKNQDGELLMNVVNETELLPTPPHNRAKI